MLTLQTIKADPEYVIRRLAVKGFDGKEVINKVLDIDAERRRLQQKTDSDASELKKLRTVWQSARTRSAIFFSLSPIFHARLCPRAAAQKTMW